ncbi:MAG: SRPBCC family protein [Candidatus Acidiferrales bacterium]
MKDTGKLSLTASGEREIVMTRTFDARRELLFDAWTKPELMKRWLYGPEDWPLMTCEIDLKVGGALRLVWHHRDGKDMGLGGRYREVTPPDRLVWTEFFDEDWTGGETLVTTVFTEHAGKTTIMMTVLYSSRAARDAVLKTPMGEGMAQSYDRLSGLLASGLAREGSQGAAKA